MRILLMIVVALYSLSATAQDSSKDSHALCQKGDLEACMNHAYYGEFEAESKPFPKSGIKLLKSACKKEDARACVGLGSVLRREPKPDLKSAREAFQKACDIAQSPKSKSELGSGVESILTGKSTLQGACVSVMELGCEMEGNDACKAGTPKPSNRVRGNARHHVTMLGWEGSLAVRPGRANVNVQALLLMRSSRKWESPLWTRVLETQKSALGSFELSFTSLKAACFGQISGLEMSTRMSLPAFARSLKG